ncbi:DUF6541 family protein [Anaerosacchariphilus polymeriproducens]|uniref:Membrane protein 6-pyruvoyl-tetrahydropterin synthase-related domain-containing protein n=1 Tax=Anaerosacchariphilus polymeriproducens TaxID=1812858 RepID=A0A371AWB3_9FIRM|nr:DUF6541 family protein [Anaerosacchariphilus polymeriproducens]RDU23866.1 hypothetical protein DWV06_07225 [Anaerosacchariphilus polymeriproducens]
MKKNSTIIIFICALIVGGLLMLNYPSDNTYTFSASDCVTSNHKETTGEDGTVTIDESSGYKGAFLYSKVLNLRKGHYLLNVSYQSDKDNTIIINTNLGQVQNQVLPASSTAASAEIEFTLSQDCDTVQFISIYNGSGSITIHNMNLTGSVPFYTDAIFLGFLTIFLGICLSLYFKKRKILVRSNNSEIIGFIFIAVIIFASYPLFTDYLIGGHDINYHLSRIEGIKDGLISGQFPVDIYPQINFGYGYLGTLYPSLFLYFPAILRILGVSMALSYKTFLVIINISTILITYYSLRKMSCTKYAAAFASIVYCLMPYRLTNLYIRGALGETLALIFLPLMISGIYQICLGNRKKWFLLAFAFTGLIHSHILSVLICIGICAILTAFYMKNILKEKRWLELLKAAFATLLLNLWYLISFLYYFKGNFNSGAFHINFSDQTIFPQQLFQTLITAGSTKISSLGSYNEMPQTIGLIGILSIFIILLYLIFDKDKKNELIHFSTTLFGLTMVFMFAITTLFPWETLQKIGVINRVIGMIQFPWRLLGFIGAFIAVTLGVLIDRKNRFTKYKLFISSGLAISLLFGSSILMDTYANQEISFTKISGGYTHTAPDDYLPKGTTKDTFNVTTPIVSSEKNISIESYEKRSTTIHLTYSCNTTNGYIDLPIMYYKGYKAFNENRSLTVVKSPENRVRVLLNETVTSSTITVSRQMNPVFIISIIFSFVFTIGLLFYIFNIYRKESQK